MGCGVWQMRISLVHLVFTARNGVAWRGLPMCIQVAGSSALMFASKIFVEGLLTVLLDHGAEINKGDVRIGQGKGTL